MTVATYTSDLSDIFLWETTTGVTATGGGGAGLSAAIDFAMEGTNAVDKQVNGTEKGMMYDNTDNFTIGSDDHFFHWTMVSTSGSCNHLHVKLGDDTDNFVEYTAADEDGPSGNFQRPYRDLAGDVYAIRFNNTESEGDGRTWVVGTPSTTPSWIGGQISNADAKGPNYACDGTRIGTGYDILNGTGADPEANFAGIAADDISTSEGIFLPAAGGFRLLGKLRIGSASTACEFLDSNLLISIKLTAHCLDDFSEILIEHADSIITLEDITFKGLWTQNRGRFEVLTSSATVNLTDCIFLDFGDTVFGSGSTCSDCNWINCNTVTANGADMTGCVITDYEEAADTSPLIWNVATDPNGLLDDMLIVKGTLATHAIEFGTSSPTTMTLTDIDFSGYNASNAQNDSTFHILRTTGTVTITIIGGSGNTSYKTAGATVIIVQNPVDLTLTVTDIDTKAAISGARVYVTPEDNTGPFPWEETVTITRVSTTASVSHTAHGMLDSQLVFIEGADQPEYNGIKTISNVSTNAYDYTVSGSPDTPATGTITATAVIINGTTNGSGIITDNREYAADQPIDGRVRMSSSAPFYRTASVVGTIDKDIGLNIAAPMIKDQ